MCTGCGAQKTGSTTFLLQIKDLVQICALAHNFVHKNCAETGSAGVELQHRQTAKIFIAKISTSKINDLRQRRPIPHKFIHRNCGQVSCVETQGVAGQKSHATGAKFLCMEKYPLRIKDLSCMGLPCAHFYPQKVCRTLLAAKRATRYIAQFVHV